MVALRPRRALPSHFLAMALLEARRLEGLEIEPVSEAAPFLTAASSMSPVGQRWPAGRRALSDDFLDVTMHWVDGEVQRGRAKYAHSGLHRDCFVWHDSSQGYAFKLATEKKAQYTSVEEVASAAALGDVVPPVYGAFYVDIGPHKRQHCLVTLAVDTTMSDQLEAWTKHALTAALAIEVIHLVIRGIRFLVHAAGERDVACWDWHIGHLGMLTTPAEERLYLIVWYGNSISPVTSGYKRIRPGMCAFFKWLPYPVRDNHKEVVLATSRAWRNFLVNLQRYLMDTWWRLYQNGRPLPTERDLEKLEVALCGVVLSDTLGPPVPVAELAAERPQGRWKRGIQMGWRPDGLPLLRQDQAAPPTASRWGGDPPFRDGGLGVGERGGGDGGAPRESAEDMTWERRRKARET